MLSLTASPRKGRQDGHLRSIGVEVAVGVADIAEGRERVGIEAGNVEELRLLAADGLALRVHLLMAHFEDVAFLQAVQRDRVLAAVVVDLWYRRPPSVPAGWACGW